MRSWIALWLPSKEVVRIHDLHAISFEVAFRFFGSLVGMQRPSLVYLLHSES